MPTDDRSTVELQGTPIAIQEVADRDSSAPAGALIASRYRLGDWLGAGAMGSVFRAYDELQGRDVAVKLMAERLADDELARRRFRREATICARLHHSHVVAGFDGGYDEGTGRFFMVMELVEGDDLADLAVQSGGLTAAEVVDAVAQIADALAYAHAEGIVHGDVSLGNILIRRSDRAAMLADFGLARSRSAQPDVPGRVVGTPRFMAPEVARGEAATPLSDLYSLAAVAYELLGATPLPIAKALAPDPAQRQASAAEFRDELVARPVVAHAA